MVALIFKFFFFVSRTFNYERQINKIYVVYYNINNT